jgi:hypothetical protein
MLSYEGTWENDAKCGYGLFSYLKGNHRSVSGSWIDDVNPLFPPNNNTIQLALLVNSGAQRLGVRHVQERRHYRRCVPLFLRLHAPHSSCLSLFVTSLYLPCAQHIARPPPSCFHVCAGTFNGDSLEGIGRIMLCDRRPRRPLPFTRVTRIAGPAAANSELLSSRERHRARGCTPTTTAAVMWGSL